MPTTLTPQEFVNKWRGSTSTERQAYQQHFIDLCHLVGHPTPAELDPENKFFTFEAGATKQSGGNGFADVTTLTFLQFVQVVLFFLTNILILRHLIEAQFIVWHQKRMHHAGLSGKRSLI